MRQLITIIIPIYNEEEVFPQLITSIQNLIAKLKNNFEVEVLLVDDGSKDKSWDLIEKTANQNSYFKGIKLSRNFGHQIALTCGYNLAQGDAIICLDADLQDPPEVVLEMVDKWKEGFDIVYAVRESREGESWFKLTTAKLFYWLIAKIGNTNSPQNSGDFRLMSKNALDAFNKMPERHRYIRGMVGWIGFDSTIIHYKRKPRAAGETKYPLHKMIGLAVNAIVSMSYTPIRLAYFTAVIIAIPFLVYLVRALIMWLFFNAELEKGWASLLICIIVFGTANLFFIGIIGEYIGRIYEESKRRPIYFISKITKQK